MSTDFNKTFGPFARGSGATLERLQVEVGFTCIRGNKGPYFSLTHHSQDARLVGGQLIPKKNGGESFGCFSEELLAAVPALAFLKPALSFHLFDPEHGPMHYEANGLYRIQQAAGEHAGTIHAPREHDPDPWQAFLNHICWGSIPSDLNDDSEALRREATKACNDDRKLWLQARLPLLIERFHQVIEEIGLSEQLKQAKQWFVDEGAV